MFKVIKFSGILFLLILLFYLMLPSPAFPEPPPDSLESHEPADTETPLRRAYFTNAKREEIMKWYENQFEKNKLIDLSLLTYRLNYPPENAQSIIRDQTRSTYLEEIVHPFRESLYVNGFEPKEEKDKIFIEGRAWEQKIIVRYVPSGYLARILVFVLSIITGFILINMWKKTIKDVKP